MPSKTISNQKQSKTSYAKNFQNIKTWFETISQEEEQKRDQKQNSTTLTSFSLNSKKQRIQSWIESFQQTSKVVLAIIGTKKYWSQKREDSRAIGKFFF